MPVKKMRVDVYDETGNRYTISFEGRVTRDKALRVLDIVELLGGIPGMGPELDFQRAVSKISRIHSFVEKRFPLVWFSAKDVQPLYEKEAGEPASLSTVSTYLSRLVDKGLLSKIQNSNRVYYRVVPQTVKTLVERL